jgi:hypothetical protein
MGKQRREQPQDTIFADNPFLDGLLDWMGSPEGQQCIAVRDVLWDLMEHVQLDAKQRKLIWPDAEPLDLEQSIQRIQKEYPEFLRGQIEEFLQLDRHGLRSAKLLPGAPRRARQPHRAVGRRPSSKGKGLKKAEENSALLSYQLRQPVIVAGSTSGKPVDPLGEAQCVAERFSCSESKRSHRNGGEK